MTGEIRDRHLARRQLLKRLAAGGAAAGAAASLPDRWVTPVIHLASRPLHAQVSAPPINPESLAGNWIGSWTDVVAELSGAAAMTITVDPGPRTFQIVLDLDGPVFGSFDPVAQSFAGSYTDAGGVIGFQVVPRFGVPAISITPAGVITGSIAPLPEMGSVQITGTVTASTLLINYTAVANGQPHEGSLSLTRA